MSGKCIGWAMKQMTGSPVTKLVLLKLADNANEDGECWPSIKLMVAHTELSERTVREHLQKLEDLKLIRIDRRKQNGVNLRNTYFLNVEQDRVGGIAADAPRGIAAPAGVVQPTQKVVQELQGGTAGAAGQIEPLTEPLLNLSLGASEREAEALGVGEEKTATIADVCDVIAMWPNVDPDFSRDEVAKAFSQLAAPRPTGSELLECAVARGQWLRESNARRSPAAGPRLVEAPHRWVSSRKWESELKRVHERRAERLRSEGEIAGLQSRLGSALPLLCKAGLSADLINGWFSNCAFEPQPVPTFVFWKQSERNWVDTNYSTRLRSAFGCDVKFIAGKRAAA